jgi:hypothetical protein
MYTKTPFGLSNNHSTSKFDLLFEVFFTNDQGYITKGILEKRDYFCNKKTILAS